MGLFLAVSDISWVGLDLFVWDSDFSELGVWTIVSGVVLDLSKGYSISQDFTKVSDPISGTESERDLSVACSGGASSVMSVCLATTWINKHFFRHV